MTKLSWITILRKRDRFRAPFAGFDRFQRGYVDGAPPQNGWITFAEVPATTPLSMQIAKDVKKAVCRFRGPMIVLLSCGRVGMVNDHVLTSSCHAELAAKVRLVRSKTGGGPDFYHK